VTRVSDPVRGRLPAAVRLCLGPLRSVRPEHGAQLRPALAPATGRGRGGGSGVERCRSAPQGVEASDPPAASWYGEPRPVVVRVADRRLRAVEFRASWV